MLSTAMRSPFCHGNSTQQLLEQLADAIHDGIGDRRAVTEVDVAGQVLVGEQLAQAVRVSSSRHETWWSWIWLKNSFSPGPRMRAHGLRPAG